MNNNNNNQNGQDDEDEMVMPKWWKILMFLLIGLAIIVLSYAAYKHYYPTETREASTAETETEVTTETAPVEEVAETTEATAELQLQLEQTAKERDSIAQILEQTNTALTECQEGKKTVTVVKKAAPKKAVKAVNINFSYDLLIYSNTFDGK